MEQIHFIEKAMVLCSCLAKGHIMSGSHKKNARFLESTLMPFHSSVILSLYSHICEFQENVLPFQLVASVAVDARE